MQIKIKALKIALMVLTVAVLQNSRPPDAAARTVQELPVISAESLIDGLVIDQKYLHDQVLLVNFFATWCGPCREEIPNFTRLQENYAARGFSVIGISTDTGAPVVMKFIKKMAINYPVIMGDPAVGKKFGGIASIPVSFLIDRSGRVVEKLLGYVDYSVIHQKVQRLL